SLHFEFTAFERMASPFHVLRPKCANDQQTLSANPLAEMSKQIDARRVGPMNVFKQNHQRIVPCQLPERVSHFPQHSFLSGAYGFSLQTFQRSSRNKSCWKLQAPGGSVGSQNCRNPLAPGTAQKRSDRVQEREVSFARSVLLYTAAARDQQARVLLPGATHQFIGQRTLTNSRFARDKDHSTRAGNPLLQ